MQSTAQILNRIESAAFEKLAGLALRKMYPYLAHLIQAGINAEGRTIPAYSDAFCFAERDHYIMMHATVNASDLNGKWFYDGDAKGKPKGDLIKGILQARMMHQENPQFRFTIFLVTNKPVDEKLHIKVHARNTDTFIESIIVEQRDLVTFFDNEPEGQYLRHRYLGIDADRISHSLLAEMTQENLRRYGKEIHLEESHLARLSGQKQVEGKIEVSPTSLNLLTGDSGFGKSTLCYSMMHVAINGGKVALRIKPSIIERANTLEDAILKQLVDDFPKIYVQQSDITVLFNNALLIVDDLNKSQNPIGLLEKLISWSEPAKETYLRIVCPAWPRNISALENRAKKESRHTVISLTKLSFNDCRAIISRRIDDKGFQLTQNQIHSLIFDTAFDPLLLDLSLDKIEERKQFAGSIAEEAIKNYVSGKVLQIHVKYQYPVDTINRSVLLLGAGMLRNRKLDPNLSEITEWTASHPGKQTILESIAAERQLFFFDDLGKCFFRHDRVRDYFLSVAAADLLKDFLPNREALSDPYFAEIIGAALAIYSVPRETIEHLIENNPLAVFISLKFLQSQASSVQFTDTVQTIEKWNQTIATAVIPQAITTSISNALMAFDTRNIEVITKGMPSTAELQLAKFRNGDWLSCIKFFSFIDYFYPEATTYWWDTILNHVKSTYLDKTITGLIATLHGKFTPEGIGHAYTLCGFLETDKLMAPLSLSWQQHQAAEYYIQYLWAVLRCFTSEDSTILADAFLYWKTIPEETRKVPIGKRLSSRSMKGALQSVDWSFTAEQIMIIAENAADPDIKALIVDLFLFTDSPIAFAIVLDIEMQREEKDDPWQDTHDSRWDQKKTRHRLSHDSLDYLSGQFSDHTLPPVRRYLAWRYWTGNVDEGIAMQKLQSMNLAFEPLYDDIILWRVSHYDLTAFEDLKNCVSRRPYLIRMLDTIWNTGSKNYFITWLDEAMVANDTDLIGYAFQLLESLDNQDAVEILVARWTELKKHKYAIALALFLSTEQTRQIADGEIKRLGYEPGKKMKDFYYRNLDGLYIEENGKTSKEQKKDLLFLGEEFKYMHMHFATKLNGKERLTKEKLESLSPYFDLMDSFSLYQYATDCLRFGLRDLCFEKIYPLLDTHFRGKLKLTLERLESEIVGKFFEMERENKVAITHWIEELEGRGVTDEMLSGALDNFLQTHRNENAFFIASIILEHLGTRKSLPLIESFMSDPDTQTRNNNYWRNNTSFAIKRKTLQ